jgi:hypothetical protein
MEEQILMVTFFGNFKIRAKYYSFLGPSHKAVRIGNTKYKFPKEKVLTRGNLAVILSY